jgi:hypothetical protein
VIASIDSASGAVSKTGYLPYGKSAATTPFGFTGQRLDPETGGLYFYRARHYAGLGPVHATGPDRVWGRQQSLCVCRQRSIKSD